MSSLADHSASSRGIPIPLDEIRTALESAAVPGYTGVLQLEIGLAESAAQAVMIGVIRRQTLKVDALPAGGAVDQASAQLVTRQQLPDPTRRKPVQNVIDQLKARLMIRTVVTAVEVHYVDGVAMKITAVE